jgi:YebC/PmpR family DNA-binding regulatory protein
MEGAIPMAGHSKWANIKHRKMAQDAKKGQAFAKFSREIIMATKLGGADPAGNFRLKTAIERAKMAGLPNDTIERAIAKGAGQTSADNYENLSYEGYGPGGVAVYVQAMTDNRNRTAGDIRSYFNKYGGNLGESGCVSWIFQERGQIHIPAEGMTEEELLEIALESGAEDFHFNPDEEVYEIWTEPDALNEVCQALQARSITIDSAEITRIPQNTIQVTDENVARSLLKLLDMLESHDDVQNVYANFEMEEVMLEACSPA